MKPEEPCRGRLQVCRQGASKAWGDAGLGLKGFQGGIFYRSPGRNILNEP